IPAIEGTPGSLSEPKPRILAIQGTLGSLAEPKRRIPAIEGTLYSLAEPRLCNLSAARSVWIYASLIIYI
ncbi:hypothetical protein, partial [Paenibacillus pasadenensis]|uniref:hypothetical protein n=2 Tax=Paenibacillus TaxID=44249 RepID=UPI00146C7527